MKRYAKQTSSKLFYSGACGGMKQSVMGALAAFALLLAGGGQTALAAPQSQPQSDEVIEEVVVTGIRSSLSRSMDVKRNAIGVVDAITAEEIGKFPDGNLAESLQRVPGVSIDRRNGEGFQVTVRGFGPHFNQVTLNGRAMPTALLNEGDAGINASRSFDMSNIAPDGVAGVVVHKSGRVDIPTGGIGATVDLQTRKPFQQPMGINYAASAKLLSDTTNRVGSSMTPELSGFASWREDNWGLSASFSTQDRSSARTGAFTNGWDGVAWAVDENNIPNIPNGVTSTQTPVIENAPRAGTEASGTEGQPGYVPAVPGQQTNFTPGLRYTHLDYERSRQNTQITFQFSPNDRMEATLDYTSATQEIESSRNELSFWFGGGAFPTSAISFQHQDGVATPLYWLTENEPNSYEARDVNYGVQGGHIKNELSSVGLNLLWQVNDEMVVQFDHHTSDSSSLPGGNGPGGWWNVGIGAQGVSVQGIDNSGDLPILVGVWRERPENADGAYGPGNVAGAPDVGDLSSTVRQIRYARTTSDISQTQIKLEWQLDHNKTVDFGIDSRGMEYTNRQSFDQTVLEGNWGAANTGDIPPGMVEQLNFHDLFDGYSSDMSSGARAFFTRVYDADDATRNPDGGEFRAFGRTAFIAKDSSALGALLSRNAGLDWAPNPVDDTNRLIEEDILALYAQIRMEGELPNGMTYNLLAGLRSESTDVTSSAQIPQPTIVWQGDNDFNVQGGDAASAPIIVNTASYSHTLPGLSIALNVAHDKVVRFSYSTSIARASYDTLQHGVGGVGAPQGGPTLLGGEPGGATNGNVGLLPVESGNLDLAFEWYYAPDSYLSAGYFSKSVPNFIGNQEVRTVADTTRDPSNGPRAEAARAALMALDGVPVNQQTLFAMVASMSTEGQGCKSEDTASAQRCGGTFSYGGSSTAFNALYEGMTGWESNVDITALPEDPLLLLDANTPVNANDADISGWEFALQHFFGDSGFGVQVNMTIVDGGDIEYDVDATGGTPQFALTGISNSTNLVLIYDRGPWQGRLAYNQRDAFLNSANVGGNEPQHTEAYSQVDLSVGYRINESWHVNLEGINVTGQDIRQYGRTTHQFRSLEILGARWALSTRYSF